MAIEFRGSVSGTSFNNGNLTLDLTTIPYLAEDDFLVIAYSLGNNGDLDIDLELTDETGYTKELDLYSDDVFEANLAVFTKVMGTTPDTTVTCILKGGGDTSLCACAMAFRGVDPITPLATPAVGDDNNLDTYIADAPSITFEDINVAVVAVWMAAHHDGSGTFTLPTGYTTDGVTLLRTETTYSSFGMGYKLLASSPEDPGAVTVGGSDSTDNSWCALTLALKPLVKRDINLPIVGYTAEGGTRLATNRIIYYRAYLGHACTVDKISVYGDTDNIGLSFQGALYSSTLQSFTNGAPENLLVTSVVIDKTIPDGSPEWFTMHFEKPMSFAAGTHIFMSIVHDGTGSWYPHYDDNDYPSGTNFESSSASETAFSDPADVGGPSGDWDFSMYLEITLDNPGDSAPLPNGRLLAPSMLIPGRKPVGPVKIDWSNPLAKGTKGYWLTANGDELTNNFIVVDKDKMSAKNGNMLFNGTDSSLILEDSDYFEGWRGLTIHALVRMDNLSTNNTIVGKHHTTSSLRTFILEHDTSGGFSFGVATNDNTIGYADSGAPQLVDTWYHVTATWSPETSLGSLYVGGEFIDSVSKPGSYVRTNSADMYIGARSSASIDNFFSGEIAFVHILGVAQADREIESYVKDPYQFLIPA